jgi:hypothetical protein
MQCIRQIRSTVFQQLGHESTTAALLFSGFSAPLLFPHGSANQCQLHHLSNRLDVLVAPFGAFVQVFFKVFFPSRQHLVFVG